jgi:adenylate kinase family enzyme
MPLKLMFFGPRVAGKSSHAAKLAEKYGVLLINPK